MSAAVGGRGAPAQSRCARLRCRLRPSSSVQPIGFRERSIASFPQHSLCPLRAEFHLASQISRLTGIAVRRSDIGAGETVTRRGYPATSMVRTLADLGRRLPLVDAVAALDMALHRRLLKSDDLRSWACARSRYPGIRRLRQTIELAEPATESVMETRLRLLLVMARLPTPQAQVPLHDRAGRFVGRPDFYYLLHCLALEYDGAHQPRK